MKHLVFGVTGFTVFDTDEILFYLSETVNIRVQQINENTGQGDSYRLKNVALETEFESFIFEFEWRYECAVWHIQAEI